MTQVEAAAEGVVVMAGEGNVSAARLFLGLHSEAKEKGLRWSVEAVEHSKLSLHIAASLRAAKYDRPDRAELEPPASGIKSVGAEVEDQMRPSEAAEAPGDWSDEQCDAPISISASPSSQTIRGVCALAPCCR